MRNSNIATPFLLTISISSLRISRTYSQHQIIKSSKLTTTVRSDRQLTSNMSIQLFDSSIPPYGHSAVNFPKMSHHERLCHVDFDGRTNIHYRFTIPPSLLRTAWMMSVMMRCDLWWCPFGIPCFMFVLSFVGRIGDDVFASSDFPLLLARVVVAAVAVSL